MKKMLAVLVASMAFLAALATAAGGGVPAGKSYKISFTYAAKIGSNQLAPGAYTVAVDTASVKMTEVKTGKSFDVPAKIEAGDRKFESTASTTQKVGEVVEVREIRLGGSKIQINFR